MKKEDKEARTKRMEGHEAKVLGSTRPADQAAGLNGNGNEKPPKRSTVMVDPLEAKLLEILSDQGNNGENEKKAEEALLKYVKNHSLTMEMLSLLSDSKINGNLIVALCDANGAATFEELIQLDVMINTHCTPGKGFDAISRMLRLKG